MKAMLLALALLLAPLGHAATPEVSYSFSLDKASYFVGEPIVVERRWTNLTKRAMTLKASPQTPLPLKFVGTPRKRGQIRATRELGDEYFPLEPGKTHTERYRLNPLDGWDVDKPLQAGTFVVSAPYASRRPVQKPGTKPSFPDAWTGSFAPPGVTIVLHELTGAELEAWHARALKGEREAVVVYALNAGDAAIPELVARFGAADKAGRDAIARALFFLGTGEAMRAFAKLALRKDITQAELGLILTRLQGARDPAIAPVLRHLLDNDTLSKGFTKEADGSQTYVYWVRDAAAEGLKALGEKIPECLQLTRVIELDGRVRDTRCSARKSTEP
jgi:hypothetical protein